MAGFKLLAFASTVEPLRVANQLSQHPLYHWRVLSDSGRAVVSSSGIPVGVDGVNAEQRSSLAALLTSRNPAVLATVNLMNRHIDDPLSMGHLAAASGYSRRHLERLSGDAVSTSPGDFYLRLRLDRGRNLLSTTYLTLMEV